jgi:carboxyl-terminal processing protease
MKQLLGFVALAFLIFINASNSRAQFIDEGLNCKFIDPIQKGFLDHHVSVKSADSNVRNHLIDQYIKRLDPSKIFFLQSDVDYIKSSMAKLFDQLRQGDCSVLDLVQKRYVERVAERVDYAKKLLDDKFKVDSTIEFEFDPDKRAYAKSAAEVHEFLKKYITFQVANYMITDMKLDEARGNVVRNYERLLKRTQEKKKGDIFADYLDSFARSLDPHSSFFPEKLKKILIFK